MARGGLGGGGRVVGGEPAAQGGVLQLSEGLGLDLAHALAGEPEVVADLLQGAWGRAVEAVAGEEDGAGARFQGGQRGAHGGRKLPGLGFVVGPEGVRVGEEVAQGAGFIVTHQEVEGHRDGQGRGEGVHAGQGEARGGGQLGGGGGMAEGGVQGVGLAGEAGAVLLHVAGDVGEGDLRGQGAADGLLDPPDGVGAEAIAARGIEQVDGAQEADGALLHEVVEGEATMLVAQGDGVDEAAIRGDEGDAGGVAGGEGILVEEPAVQGARHGRQVVEHPLESTGGHGWDRGRGEGQAGGEGSEDGAGGSAGGRGGGQVAAQAGGEVALGQQAGAAARARSWSAVSRAGTGAIAGAASGGVIGSPLLCGPVSLRGAYQASRASVWIRGRSCGRAWARGCRC